MANASVREVTKAAADVKLKPETRRNWLRLYDAKKLPEEHLARLAKHYRDNPFNLIWDGALKITNKDGDLVRFAPNEEQAQVLAYVQQQYEAKQMVRVIVLKGRQIGMSTLAMAIIFVMTMNSSHKKAHLVTQQKMTAKNLMFMFRNYYKYLPDCMKPKQNKNNRESIEFDDPEFGCEGSLINVDSAETREKMSLGWTYQFNNFSEKAFWPDQELIAGALKPTIPNKWPSIIIEESTGDKFNDLFYQDYVAARDGGKPGWKAFFFPWQKHKEYQIPLSVELDEFMDALSEDDKAYMVRHELTPEQMNWFLYTRDDYCRSNAATADVFRRMYPATEEEAFYGSGASFYATEQFEQDKDRVNGQKLCKLEDLPESVSLITGAGPKLYARCELVRDGLNGYKGAQFIDSSSGDWTVWERPRPKHRYVIAADIAEGKQAIKGVRNSGDFSVLDSVRFTYEPNESPTMVQVAQFRSQSIDPRELAREAMGASVVYKDQDTGRNAKVIPERNQDGKTFIEQGKDDGMLMYVKEIFGSRGEKLTEEYGFQTTKGEGEASRIQILTQSREVWKLKMYQVNSLVTVREMGLFARNEKGKWEALRGHHDDTVMTKALAIECVRKENGAMAAPIAVKPIVANTAISSVPQFYLKIHERPPLIELPKSPAEREMEEMPYGF